MQTAQPIPPGGSFWGAYLESVDELLRHGAAIPTLDQFAGIVRKACLLRAVREYTTTIPVVQNLDFGHTNPQIAMPYGGVIRIDSTARRMWARF